MGGEQKRSASGSLGLHDEQNERPESADRKAAWQPVKVRRVEEPDGTSAGLVCVTGGLHRAQDGAVGVVLECEERAVKDSEGNVASEAFVRVAKNLFWVLKLVGGGASVKGDLQHTTLMGTLYSELRSGAGESVADPDTPEKIGVAIAAAGASAPDVGADPMEELTRGIAQPARKTPKKAKKRPRGTVATLCVPKSARPDEPAMQRVMVYETPNASLFIRSKDLPWFLRYMYEETQGVAIPEPAPADAGPADDSRPWVSRWSPDGAWHVRGTGGGLEGRKWGSRVQDLTEEKWAVGAPLAHVETPLQRASNLEKKDVLLAYLEHVVAEALKENQV